MRTSVPDKLDTLVDAVVPDGVVISAERLHDLPDLVGHLQLGQLYYLPAVVTQFINY
jgi:hypothetical protein